jgi:putative ABC transport system substrate-binding protein
MNRREFIAGLGVVALPPVARAQQAERMRRIGMLTTFDENEPVYKPRVAAFTQALADLGWTNGGNVRMDIRGAGGNINRIRALAQELVGSQPDIIMTSSTPTTVAVQRQTGTIPILFTGVSDPVASGIVARLDRPGGTSPASPTAKPPWEASGLSCSWRLRPGSRGPQLCSIPIRPPHRPICPHLRRRPGHSRSRQSLRPSTRRRDRNRQRPAREASSV